MDNNKLARILVVDDEESYLAAMRRILRGQYEVITTQDPMQALKIFELQGPFAAVISDFQMPFINGIELFSRINTLNNDTQRIMLTGHADLQMAIDAVNRGKITAFLTKPTPALSIRTLVKEAVRAYEQTKAKGIHSVSVPKDSLASQRTSEFRIQLTVKEMEVLSLLAKGYSNKEVSQELDVSVGTAKCHMTNLFGKLGVNSRAKLVAKGIELGLIKPP